MRTLFLGGRNSYYLQNIGGKLILCQVYPAVNWKRPRTGTEGKNVASL
jgi:hypothetical protein